MSSGYNSGEENLNGDPYSEGHEEEPVRRPKKERSETYIIVRLIIWTLASLALTYILFAVAQIIAPFLIFVPLLFVVGVFFLPAFIVNAAAVGQAVIALWGFVEVRKHRLDKKFYALPIASVVMCIYNFTNVETVAASVF